MKSAVDGYDRLLINILEIKDTFVVAYMNASSTFLVP